MGSIIEHGWTMPRGLMASKERDPGSFALAQWQRAKRGGKHAEQVREALPRLLDNPESLPTVEMIKREITKMMTARLQTLGRVSDQPLVHARGN